MYVSVLEISEYDAVARMVRHWSAKSANASSNLVGVFGTLHNTTTCMGVRRRGSDLISGACDNGISQPLVGGVEAFESVIVYIEDRR